MQKSNDEDARPIGKEGAYGGSCILGDAHVNDRPTMVEQLTCIE